MSVLSCKISNTEEIIRCLSSSVLSAFDRPKVSPRFKNQTRDFLKIATVSGLSLSASIVFRAEAIYMSNVLDKQVDNCIK